MSKPPPENLKDWSKNDLRREVERLRAITREMAERHGDDPRAAATTGAAVTDVTGDPYARGGAVLDMRAAVLLDAAEVVLVDAKRDEPPSMMLTLSGRINYAPDRVQHAYLFGPDGAAALVTELIGLAVRAGDRFGAEFQADFDRRMAELP